MAKGSEQMAWKLFPGTSSTSVIRVNASSESRTWESTGHGLRTAEEFEKCSGATSTEEESSDERSRDREIAGHGATQAR